MENPHPPAHCPQRGRLPGHSTDGRAAQRRSHDGVAGHVGSDEAARHAGRVARGRERRGPGAAGAGRGTLGWIRPDARARGGPAADDGLLPERHGRRTASRRLGALGRGPQPAGGRGVRGRRSPLGAVLRSGFPDSGSDALDRSRVPVHEPQHPRLQPGRLGTGRSVPRGCGPDVRRAEGGGGGRGRGGACAGGAGLVGRSGGGAGQLGVDRVRRTRPRRRVVVAGPRSQSPRTTGWPPRGRLATRPVGARRRSRERPPATRTEGASPSPVARGRGRSRRAALRRSAAGSTRRQPARDALRRRPFRAGPVAEAPRPRQVRRAALFPEDATALARRPGGGGSTGGLRDGRYAGAARRRRSARARNALPRWLRSFFAAGASSANERAEPTPANTGS